MNDTSAGSETRIPLELIEPNPWQVRLSEDDEAVEKLAISIEANGLMQVPTARPSKVKRPDGKYGWQLAFGHTRFAAFQHLASQGKADYVDMPLLIRELTDQQMFERAVAENVQRRDLTPIEEATAMQRAMTDFQFTSAQAGELFGVAAETVRGTVRLLKLPQAIQARVAAGDMTIRSARQFLTVQQVDPKAAAAAAKSLVKDPDSMDNENVDRTLEEAMRRSQATIKMWRGHQSGEPRGGDDLWPLTWQAKGLAPVSAGRFGEGTEIFAHLASPPKCTECKFYAKLNGDHFCGLKDCWVLKAEAWLRTEADRLSRKLGIPIYNAKTDGKIHSVYQSSWDEWGPGFKAAIASKKSPAREGLRIVVKPQDHNYYHDSPATGSRHFQVVDVLGRVKKQKRSSFSSGHDTGYQRRHLAIKRSEDFVKGVAAPALGPAFAGLKSLPVLEAMTGFGSRRDIYSDATDKARKEYKTMGEAAKRKYLQTELARQLIMERRSVLEYRSAYSNTVWSKGPVALANALRPVAKQWGVQLPVDWLKQAKAMMPKPERKAKGKKGKRK